MSIMAVTGRSRGGLKLWKMEKMEKICTLFKVIVVVIIIVIVVDLLLLLLLSLSLEQLASKFRSGGSE